MATGNGNDRLDRIEAAVEAITGAGAAVTGILRQVAEQQQRFQLGMNELRDNQQRFQLGMNELRDKLDGLIGVVETEHRNFNERLKRLES